MLEIDQFKKVVKFLQGVCHAARNEKKMSGNHGDFGAAVGGRVYLLYMHHCLIELGDKAFDSCFYLELSANAKHTSGSDGQY
jgi:hypothetical protein